MKIKAEIVTPFYDHGGRKYLDLRWDGFVYQVKVPFRYGRIMAKVLGDKTIQEMPVGTQVEVVIEYKTWDCISHKVLYSIKEI
jgi:hypothetical protein